MLRNHFIVGIRNIKKQFKSFSFNIIGLCVAMACCIITAGWAFYEHSYDRFHSKAGQIYRILEKDNATGKYNEMTQSPIVRIMKENFPEVQNSTGLSHSRLTKFASENKQNVKFEFEMVWADTNFLKIFDFGPKLGTLNPFTKTNSIIITEKVAQALFSSKDVIGKTILLGEKATPFQISGVIDNIKENSSLRFDALMSEQGQAEFLLSEFNYRADFTKWREFYTESFILLRNNADLSELKSKMSNILSSFIPGYRNTLTLQPLTDIHLSELPFSSMAMSGDKNLKTDYSQINLFIGIALSTLLMACINFINLSLASTIKRSKEIGVRKVAGASQKDIMIQHMTESFVLSSISAGVGIILAFLLLPTIRDLTGRELELSSLPLVPFALSVIGVIAVTTVLAGFYPALISSFQNPANILRKQFFKNKSTQVVLRNILFIAQFACAGILIIITLVIISQLNYNRTKDLGFDKKNIVMLDVAVKGKEAFINELKNYSLVENIASGMAPTFGKEGHKFGIGRGVLNWNGKDPNKAFQYNFIFASTNYAKTYGLKLKEGRFFEEGNKSDESCFVINEAAAREMGLANPVGTAVTFMNRQYTIIGIVRDYHLGTLKAPISPAVFQVLPELTWGITVKLKPFNSTEAVKHITEKWKQFYPNTPLEIKYLEDELELNYISDTRLFKIIVAYSILSIIVACSGLFSLSILRSEEKRKEIGIRKVLGANSLQINFLLSRNYLMLIGISLLIAFPIGLFFARKWLDTYSYKFNLGVNIFLISSCIILFIAMLTLNYQTIKAARSNPVDSLKYE